MKRIGPYKVMRGTGKKKGLMITLPEEIRARLNVQPGDRIMYLYDEESIRLVKVTFDVI